MLLARGDSCSRRRQSARGCQRWPKVGGSTTKNACSLLLGCINVNANLLPVFFEIVWKSVGICHADCFQTKDPCHLLFVPEIRIAKFLKPGKIVEC